MKRLLGAACALLVVSASPALAADLVFGRGAATPLTEGSVGQPYWKLHAQCAGMFSASFNYYSVNGEAERAAADAEIGKAMMRASIDRLVRDRGMERKVAVDLTLLQVNAGRQQGDELLGTSGGSAHGSWNLQRSACLDIYEAYSGKYG